MGKISNTSDFYCTSCGKKGIPILRQKGKERNAGHLKKIYCIYCQREVNHVECKPFSHYDFSDFDFEYTHGNFDIDGNRRLEYGIFKDKLMKEGIVR